MFDVNVTTQLTSLPKAWEIIGNNAGGATGGYAYVGTFPDTGPTAFNTSSNARTRQSGMAHELGHVFGLQHQSGYDTLGNKIEYLSAPDPLHGPIMGVDYSGTIHKWFTGHSATSPGTLQDDLTVIANKIKAREPAGGDGYRPDDFPSTIATAAALADNGAGMQYASGHHRAHDRRRRVQLHRRRQPPARLRRPRPPFRASTPGWKSTTPTATSSPQRTLPPTTSKSP